ncbi:uncharacterized protein [Littorina saxatilis]|uniref:uncharacterized protein n=1 Tax=Littorina saxatilis TaxID=31220 RepID=UPI0038B4AAEB
MTILDKVRPSFPYRLVTACQEDSQDLTDQHRSGIAQICKEAEETFLLITHGSDTILQTAAFLAKRLFCQNTPISMINQSETPPGKADRSGNARLSSSHQSESRSSNSSQSATDFQGVSGEGGNVSTMVNNFHKLIFITGAFLPERFKDTDADFNIGVVLGAMQVGLPPGVYTCISWR